MTLFALILAGCMLEVEGPIDPDVPFDVEGEPVLDALALDAVGAAASTPSAIEEAEPAPFRFVQRTAPPPSDREVTTVGAWLFVRSGDRLWARRDWEDEQWSELGLEGAPEGSILLPYDDDAFGATFLQLVAVSYPRAWLVYPGYEGEEAELTPIELEMVAPLGTRPEDALARSRALRRMKACPRSERQCVVFGAPEDVAAAIDPLLPPHGISFARIDSPAPFESDEVDSSSSDARVGFRVGPAGNDGAPSDLTVVFRHGGTDHVAFVLPYSMRGESTAGVEVLDDRFLVWIWGGWSMTLGFSFHDRVTGERIGEPVTLAGRFYYEEAIDCGNVFTGTRPMPVLTPDGALVTVFNGANPMMLLDADGRYLRDVELAWDDLPYSGEDETLPPYFELRADGLLY